MAYKNTDIACPDWFELEAYEYSREMNLDWWANALWERAVVHGRIPYIDCDDGPYESTATEAECRSEIIDVFESTKNRRISKLRAACEYSEEFSRPVSSLNFGDLSTICDYSRDYHAESFSNTSVYRSIKNDVFTLTNDRALEGKSVDEFINMHYLKGEDSFPTTFDAYVRFDISAPLSILLEQFRAAVVEKKKLYGISKTVAGYVEKDVEKWADLKILAFLDLAAWYEVEGKFPSDQALGLMLYPDELQVSLDERIRKVVKPLAARLISPLVIESIRNTIFNLAEQRGTEKT